MGSSIHAIVVDTAAAVPSTLDALAAALRQQLARSPGAAVTVDEGAPPMKPPHVRVEWTVDDAGDEGFWYCSIQYEDDPAVAADNRRAAAAAPRTGRSAVAAATARFRAAFPDDQDRRFSSHFVLVVEFLQSLPGVVVFDPQRGDFLSSSIDW